MTVKFNIMGEKKKILVVDDEKDILTLLSSRLEMSGFEVSTARDGFEAIEKIKTIKPDLVILDIMLPKMDGFQVARLFKFDLDYKDIPIIFLTAKASEEDKNMAKEVGGDYYFVKPFNFQEMLQKIKDILKLPQ